MTLLTVTAKGQVTLRKELLEHLGVGPGDKIQVEKLPCGRVEVSAPKRTGKISDLSGVLKRPNQPTLTIEEMNEIIADSWAGGRGPWTGGQD
jgi:bifunctional DNA-binding transcriptional regulator/antitoxin component of YhaV-PrlF toxin-antitoxin module